MAIARLSLCLVTALAALVVPCTAHGQSLPELIRKTGVTGGIIVHVGCGGGRTTTQLAPTDRFVVRGVDVDPARIRSATEHAYEQGQSVPARTSFAVWADQGRLPFADNLVNILIADSAGGLARHELMRVIAPLGFLIEREGDGWQREQKPWPEGMGEWPHLNHGADGNAVTPDTIVAPPGSMRWIAGPLWLKHHNHTINFSTMVSARGRLFYIIDDSLPGVFGLQENWKLIARDGFNGTVLWTRTMGNWGWPAWGKGPSGGSRFDQPIDVIRRLAAWGDSVYVSLGTDQPVNRIDAATGEVLGTYAGSEGMSEVLYHEGQLIVSVHRSVEGSPPMRKSVLVYAADSGSLLWRRDGLVGATTKIGPLAPYTTLFMAVGGDGIFVVDGDEIACLELSDGRDRWRKSRPPKQDKPEKYSKSMLVNQCMLVAYDGMVLMNQMKYVGHTQWLKTTPSLLVAYSAKTGEELWQADCGVWDYDSQGSFFVIDGLAWTHEIGKFEMLGIDAKTGAVAKRYSTKEAMTTQHHHRCYSNKATSNFILTARRGIEYLDVRSGGNFPNHWIRGACRYGIMPANGLTYAPPDPCMCYASAKVNGLVALSGFEEVEPTPNRLTTGAAIPNPQSAIPNPQSPPANPQSAIRDPQSEWPTYRHDPERSGTGSAVPTELQAGWRTELGGKLSGVTVAAGLVFVSCTTTRTIHALDANTGAEAWRYTLAAAADSPPTLYRGLAIVGCADGCVYALRAEDGELRWAFRAAPADRQIAAFGRLESAWPVHGSVTVRGDTVYASAGRSSFLDNGINMVALNPMTGELLREHAIYAPDPETGKVTYDPMLRYDMPMDQPGALSDILVSHADHLYMRHVKIDPATLKPLFRTEITDAEHKQFVRSQGGKPYRPGPQLATNAGMLDDSWFSQTFWTYASSGHSRILVFDDTHTFGFKAFGGKPSRHSRSRFVVGKGGYTLFSEEIGKPNTGWKKPIPIRAQAMVGGPDRLVVAGAPVAGVDASLSEFAGGKAGVLWIVAKADGSRLSELSLPASPVWDGMAVASGSVYAALRDGAVIRLQPPAEGE